MKNLFLFIVFCILFLLSCTRHELLSPAAYIEWVEDTDNGLHKEKQIGELLFDVQLRPTDYILCKSNDLDGGVNRELLDSLRRQYDSTLFISITLKDTNGKDPLAQQASANGGMENVLYYFQYQFQQDIYIEYTGKEKRKISPDLFHFERFYTINNSKVFLIAFDKKQLIPNEDVTLVIDSKYLSSGLMQFLFDKKQMEEQPLIQL